MEKSTFKLENDLIENGYELIIGIDEAGRGPLAGPVVAGAVILKNSELRAVKYEIRELDLIRDSKTLSEKQREKIFVFIQENFFTGIGICSHETIDRMNILEASFLAMKKAIASLAREISNFQPISLEGELPISNEIQNSSVQSPRCDMRNIKQIILVDGNKKIPNLSMNQRAIVNGDKFVKSISAASIIAKVTRDRIMKKSHERYPQYGFDKHKGYGTKFHVEALKKYGPCKIHRKSFEPVKILVKIEK